LEEKVVTVLVAQSVVDLLEPIEVQKDDGYRRAGATSGAQGDAGSVLEQGPVREIGEPIVQRLMTQPILEKAPFRNVLNQGDDPERSPTVVEP